ncbi:hypothetical protein [Thermoactinospora rubra]|uniref:hypothetical protein n=1 Tax=Thermoactinospora rubra TaxID=1088767 RepID=UPI000A10DDCF|nr:hypothetical protein [Thermoactinospora rubra]
MSQTLATSPATAADLLLYGGAATAAAHLQQALLDGGVLAGAVPQSMTGDGFAGQIAQAAMDLLGTVSLGDVLVGAWHSHRELREAGQRTHPTGREIVTLLPHDVASEHAPSVEALLNGRRFLRVECAVKLFVGVGTVQAEVADGRLVSVGAGQGLAGVTYGLRSIEINGTVTRLHHVEVTSQYQTDVHWPMRTFDPGFVLHREAAGESARGAAS